MHVHRRSAHARRSAVSVLGTPARPTVIRFTRGSGTFRLVVIGRKPRNIEIRVLDALGDVSWRSGSEHGMPKVEDVLAAAIDKIFEARSPVIDDVLNVRSGNAAPKAWDIDIGEWVVSGEHR